MALTKVLFNCFSDAGFNPNPSVASQIAPLPATIPRPGSGGRGGILICLQKTSNYHKYLKYCCRSKLPLGFVLTSEITYNDNIMQFNMKT
jgi:hypothetical protein